MKLQKAKAVNVVYHQSADELFFKHDHVTVGRRSKELKVNWFIKYF